MFKSSVRIVLEKFPRLINSIRTIRDLSDKRMSFLRTKWAFWLAGNPKMANAEFEQEETSIVREYLNNADIFVNVGANIGYYICHAASVGVPSVAVEPVQRNLYYLMKNVRKNNWESLVRIYPVALSQECGIMEMWGSGTGASLIKGWADIPESYVNLVPVLTLDEVIGNKILDKKALILVDIEGAELGMLRGAGEVLKSRPRPVWIMEISSWEHQPQGIDINPNLLETFDIFFNEGYRAFFANSERVEVDRQFVSDLANGKVKTQCHNFIFE